MASPDPDRRRLVPNTSEVLVLMAAQRGLVLRSASYSASGALNCNSVAVLDSIPKLVPLICNPIAMAVRFPQQARDRRSRYLEFPIQTRRLQLSPSPAASRRGQLETGSSWAHNLLTRPRSSVGRSLCAAANRGGRSRERRGDGKSRDDGLTPMGRIALQ